VALFLNAIITGISIGAVYGMIAVGFTVVYNATRVFNLAQGDLMMVGVMISYMCLDIVHWPQWAAFFATVAGVTLLSMFEERVIVRPFLKKAGNAATLWGAGIGWFIATLAFSLIIETVAFNLYGNNYPRAIPGLINTAGWHIGTTTISPTFFVTVVALLIVVVFLEVFQTRTWLGRAMRASAQDRDAAALRGIDPALISLAAFALGGVVAAIGGFTVAPIVNSDPSIGLTYTLKGFLALAIGGFGSIRGAVVGGMALGIVEQLWDLYVNGSYEPVAGFILLLLVFAVRPTGIFGERMVRTV
jgi:branched-subunit amino acid ABC-type transport system permease component